MVAETACSTFQPCSTLYAVHNMHTCMAMCRFGPPPVQQEIAGHYKPQPDSVSKTGISAKQEPCRVHGTCPVTQPQYLVEMEPRRFTPECQLRNTVMGPLLFSCKSRLPLQRHWSPPRQAVHPSICMAAAHDVTM